MSNNQPVISYVLPAFNEAQNVGPMTQRLLQIAERMPRDFEIIWINDGSTDGTAEALDELAGKDPRIVVLHFSRNFGHMAALTAGFEHARATGAVICLDGDGQHPPEVIVDLLRQWQNGADIVQAVRKQQDAGFFKRTTSSLFYRVFNELCDIRISEGSADFRLLDRQVVDALNSLPERVRFLRGLVHWIGFNHVEVFYDAEPRIGGDSKYGLGKMIQFGLSGITSFSVRPLRLSFLLSVSVIGIALIYGLYIVLCYMSGRAIAPGWTSLIFVTMILGGVQLLVIGIASEYLARLYSEQKHRPVYVLRKKVLQGPSTRRTDTEAGDRQ